MGVKTTKIGAAAGLVAVELSEQAVAPTAIPAKVLIYGKDVSGTTEFFVRDENGNEIQVTSNGVLKPQVLPAPYTPQDPLLGGPTLESTVGLDYRPQQKWIRKDTSGFITMFDMPTGSRTVYTVDLLLVIGSDQNNNFYTHRHTAVHACDIGASFVTGLNGSALLSQSTGGSPYTVTTENSGGQLALRITGGAGIKEWWAAATLSQSVFGFAPP
jgi:hypothetical protein